MLQNVCHALRYSPRQAMVNGISRGGQLVRKGKIMKTTKSLLVLLVCLKYRIGIHVILKGRKSVAWLSVTVSVL